MTTAFALAGGAALGAVEVGMLQALFERDIRPDLVVGTSAGALNAAFVAGRPDLDGVLALGQVWRRTSTLTVFPPSPVDTTLGLLGLGNHLISAAGVRATLKRNLAYRRLEDAPLPVHVVAAEVTTGKEVMLSAGDAVDAVQASSAIPGIFPPVTIEGRVLMDGGVADNTPIAQAAGLGADRVYVLPTGYPCALPRPPHSALGMALHALSIVFSERLVVDIERFSTTLDLRVVPPLCPLGVNAADFSQADTLIRRGYESTRAWLDAGEPKQTAARLRPHAHPA